MIGCPICGWKKTSVVDCRTSNLNTTRRRRECPKCKARFTTYEHSPEATDVLNKQMREQFVELASPLLNFMQFHLPEMFSKDMPLELNRNTTGYLNSVMNDE
jgi:hypothetical protein